MRSNVVVVEIDRFLFVRPLRNSILRTLQCRKSVKRPQNGPRASGLARGPGPRRRLALVVRRPCGLVGADAAILVCEPSGRRLVALTQIPRIRSLAARVGALDGLGPRVDALLWSSDALVALRLQMFWVSS